MAQPKNGRKFGLAETVAAVMSNFSNIGKGFDDVGPDMDPLAAYWDDPDQVVRGDPYMAGIVNFWLNKLITDGFVFSAGEEWMEPSPDFQSILGRHYMPFAVDVFVFIYKYGYLVYAVKTLDSGLKVPIVPHMADLKVTEINNRAKGERYHVVTWEDSRNPLPLFVVDEGMPFREGSRVRQSAATLMSLYRMDEDRAVGARLMSRPPIMLENTHKGDPGRPPDQILPEQPMVDLVLRAGAAVGRDNMHIQRMQNATHRAITQRSMMKTSMTKGMAVPPHVRLQRAADEPPEMRQSYLMEGFAASKADVGKPDPGYTDVKLQALTELYLINGIPPSAILPTHKGDSVSGVVEWHRTILRENLVFWQTLMGNVLTQVLYQLHSPDELRIADIKPTYAEDHKRIVDDMEKEFAVKKILGKDFKNRKVRMGLKSQIRVSPEVAQTLFDTGVVSFDNSRRLTLIAYGLPEFLLDKKTKEPIRAGITTRDDMKFEASLRPPTAAGGVKGGASAKKKPASAAAAKKKTNSS